MGTLPDELWLLILKAGVARGLEYRDLCTLPLVCRRLRRLSNNSSLWESVWQKDWPAGDSQASCRVEVKPSTARLQSGRDKSQLAKRVLNGNEVHPISVDHRGDRACSSNHGLIAGKRQKIAGVDPDDEAQLLGSPWADRDDPSGAKIVSWKEKYRFRFEREREKRQAAHRRRVLRAQSQVAVLEGDMRTLRKQLQEEHQRLAVAIGQTRSLERMRQASEAAKVWQPRAVLTRHHQLVEQVPIDAQAQLHSCQQEIAVSKERIQRFTKNLMSKEALLVSSKRDLEALTFNPARGLPPSPETRGGHQSTQKQSKHSSGSTGKVEKASAGEEKRNKCSRGQYVHLQLSQKLDNI